MNKPTITKATIARLHNLGNYEHTRIEVEVQIPEGVHAGEVISQVSTLLDQLDPKPPINEHYLQQCKETLEKPIAELDPWETANLDSYKASIAQYEAWATARAEAILILGDLPYAQTNSEAAQDVE